MIYGKGLLAKGFSIIEHKHPDTIFLCAGVSGSVMADPTSCKRELETVNRIIKDHRSKRFVYTSSFDCYSDTPYGRHKLLIENLVRQHSHVIARVGSIVYHYQNPWQFFPSILVQIKGGNVKVTHAKKDIIYLLDYIDFMDYLLGGKWSVITSFGHKNPPFVIDIVNYIENKIGVRSNKIYCSEKSNSWMPDFTICQEDYYKTVIDRALAEMEPLKT